jgi:hypothetical protein
MKSFLDRKAPMAYNGDASDFITVAETQLFIRQAADVWTDAERNAFVDFIAANPEEST